MQCSYIMPILVSLNNFTWLKDLLCFFTSNGFFFLVLRLSLLCGIYLRALTEQGFSGIFWSNRTVLYWYHLSTIFTFFLPEMVNSTYLKNHMFHQVLSLMYQHDLFLTHFTLLCIWTTMVFDWDSSLMWPNDPLALKKSRFLFLSLFCIYADNNRATLI